MDISVILLFSQSTARKADGAAKTKPQCSEVEPVEDTSTASDQPSNLPNLLAEVTQEELSVLKCTNPKEAVAHKKHLCHITEVALKGIMKGYNTRPDDPPPAEVMPGLIQNFKRAV